MVLSFYFGYFFFGIYILSLFLVCVEKIIGDDFLFFLKKDENFAVNNCRLVSKDS